MTGDEYSKAIERLGLTQVGAARFLKIDERTSRRWVKDEAPIPHSVAILLWLMIKLRLTVEKVLNLLRAKF